MLKFSLDGGTGMTEAHHVLPGSPIMRRGARLSLDPNDCPASFWATKTQLPDGPCWHSLRGRSRAALAVLARGHGPVRVAGRLHPRRPPGQAGRAHRRTHSATYAQVRSQWFYLPRSTSACSCCGPPGSTAWSSSAAAFLEASVRAGLNILVAGGTQAGNQPRY